MDHQHKTTWKFKPKRHADLIAILEIDDTKLQVNLEERREDVWWVVFSTINRGSVPTPNIFEGVADFLEQFVIDRQPQRLTVSSHKRIKCDTYRKTLEVRAPKYGYEVEERTTPNKEEVKVFTMIRIQESK